jgi:predicted alpha/beta hydrolase family esterase
MKKRVYIIHGWGAGPKDNWFQWAKWELEAHDFEVFVPEMPNTNEPILTEWLAKMNEVVGEVDENTFFIGHSLGTITILKFLESLRSDQKVGGVILVSGFLSDFGINPQLANFVADDVDVEKIKKHCDKFIIFQSDNDPLVPISQAMKLQHELDGELTLIHEAGHLNAGTGEGEFPELIEAFLNIVKDN